MSCQPVSPGDYNFSFLFYFWFLFASCLPCFHLFTTHYWEHIRPRQKKRQASSPFNQKRLYRVKWWRWFGSRSLIYSDDGSILLPTNNNNPPPVFLPQQYILKRRLYIAPRALMIGKRKLPLFASSYTSLMLNVNLILFDLEDSTVSIQQLLGDCVYLL